MTAPQDKVPVTVMAPGDIMPTLDGWSVAAVEKCVEHDVAVVVLIPGKVGVQSLSQAQGACVADSMVNLILGMGGIDGLELFIGPLFNRVLTAMERQMNAMERQMKGRDN